MYLSVNQFFFPKASLTGKLISAKKYTVEHETVVYDDETGIGIVSITDHAQSSLGDVVFVELPSLNTEVVQGGEFFSLSRITGCIQSHVQVKSVQWKVSKRPRTSLSRSVFSNL
jgi:glycine cleavage system H protein